MRQWNKIIKSLGFSESESQIYLTTLELGPSSVQEIAKKAEVSRVTAYVAIESLMNIGLMSTVEKGKKKLYTSEPPERLVSVAKAKAKAIESTAKEMESYVDELKLLERGERPVVKVFEGDEALISVLQDILNVKPTELREYGNLNSIRSLYGSNDKISEGLSSLYKALESSSTKRKLMFFSREKPIVRSKNEQIKQLSDVKEFFGDILIYKNKVVLSAFKGKQMSVVIESEEIAETLKQMFEGVWNK